MAQAEHESTRKPSALVRDPILRAAVMRAELDCGQTSAIPNDLPNVVDFEDVRASDKPSSRKCHRGAAS